MIAVNTDLECYDKYGYVLVREAVEDSLIEDLRSRVSDGVDAFARELVLSGMIEDGFESLPFGRRLAAIFEHQEPKLRSWDKILPARDLHNLVCQERVGGALRRILGREVVFSGDFHLRPKLPGSTYTAFPWHQDSQYYGRATKDMHVVTVWTPLVDVDEINGCLWVIPESHKWGLLNGERGEDMNMRTSENVEDRGTPIPVPMRAGDALLFSNLTFHASKINRSLLVRWSIDCRYFESKDLESVTQSEAKAYAFYRGKLKTMGRTEIVLPTAEG